jgi:hypothetical protein
LIPSAEAELEAKAKAEAEAGGGVSLENVLLVCSTHPRTIDMPVE